MQIFYEIPVAYLPTGAIWGDTTQSKISHKVTAQFNSVLTDVGYWLAIFNGSPSDSVQLDIYSGGTDPENGTHIGGPYLVLGSTLPLEADFDPINGIGSPTIFNLPSSLNLIKGTDYFFTLTRTGALDDVNNYGCSASDGSNYPSSSYSVGWKYRIGWTPFGGGVGTGWGLILYNHNNEYLQTTFLSFADTGGDVQLTNVGKSDNNIPIFYELETQELEFGERSHLKKLSDKIATLNQFDTDSQLQGKPDDGTYQDLPMLTNNNVNIGKNINLEGNFFTFKWSGNTSTASPIFDGLYIENVEDKGIIKK